MPSRVCKQCGEEGPWEHPHPTDPLPEDYYCPSCFVEIAENAMAVTPDALVLSFKDGSTLSIPWLDEHEFDAEGVERSDGTGYRKGRAD